ncbi:MAG: hypothetical protein QOF89_1140 [Acidobacteriota bacterium]|jgi:hypothetical protein|nr:hypothetical protein [Acidobacteriota bacterium]
MILTDQFVAVHEPKTGGTFVTSALFQLYGARWNFRTRLASALGRDVVARGKYGTFRFTNNKHGGCNEIPQAWRDRPILASVRNPYDLYVSQYEFGWWKRREFLSWYRRVPDFERRFPRFPDLSFPEYMELAEAAFRTLRNERFDSGLYTEQFVKFYFKAPEEAFARLDDAYIASQAYRNDMHDLRFVRTSRLNQDLYDFLIDMSFEACDAELVLGLGRILPQGKGRAADKGWETYYTDDLKRSVRERDRLVFAIFPCFDV